MMDRARALSQPALAVPRPAQPATPAGAPAAPVSDTAISMAAARRIAATDGGPALLSPLAAAGLLGSPLLPPSAPSPLSHVVVKGADGRMLLYRPMPPSLQIGRVSAAPVARPTSVVYALAVEGDARCVPAGTLAATRRQFDASWRVSGVGALEGPPEEPTPSDAVEAESASLEREVRRVVGIISPAMAGRVLVLSDEETASLGDDAVSLRLAGIYRKVGVGTLRVARRALLRLHAFALSLDPPLVLIDFACSVGFVSAFLSSHTAPSVPSTLLRGLKWAAGHMGVEIDANSSVLSPFAARLPQGGHAITTPFIVCCHLERKADDEQGRRSSDRRSLWLSIHG